MRRIGIYFFVYLLLVCGKLYAVEKTDSTKYLENLILNYFADNIKKVSPADTFKIKETLSKIDFSKIQRSHFPQEQEGFSMGTLDILLLPVKDLDIHNFTGNKERKLAEIDSLAGNINSVTLAAFFVLNETGKITEGNILYITSPSYTITDIKNYFVDIIRAKRKDFTGHFIANSFSQQLSNDWEYNKGVIISSTVISSKHSAPGNTGEKVRLDWHLQITTFDSGHIKRKDAGYLFSTFEADFKGRF